MCSAISSGSRRKRKKRFRLKLQMPGALQGGNTLFRKKMMEGSSEIGIRIKGLIEIRLKKPEKEFVVIKQ